MKKSTTELETLLHNKPLEDTLSYTQEQYSFHMYLNQLMEAKGYQKQEIIRQSEIPRTYAYQLFQGTKLPGRDKILQLAIAMRLNLEETNRLLKLGNHSILYVRKKRDALIYYAITHQLSLIDANLLLYEHGQEVLGEA